MISSAALDSFLLLPWFLVNACPIVDVYGLNLVDSTDSFPKWLCQFFFFAFKDLFILIWKAELPRGEPEVSLPSIGNDQSWAGLKFRSFFWFSHMVQGPKDLGHFLLSFWAINRELDGKRSIQDLNWYLYGMLAPHQWPWLYQFLACRG